MRAPIKTAHVNRCSHAPTHTRTIRLILPLIPLSRRAATPPSFTNEPALVYVDRLCRFIGDNLFSFTHTEIAILAYWLRDVRCCRHPLTHPSLRLIPLRSLLRVAWSRTGTWYKTDRFVDIRCAFGVCTRVRSPPNDCDTHPNKTPPDE